MQAGASGGGAAAVRSAASSNVPDVDKEDQRRICRFSNLINRRNELDAQLEAVQVELRGLEDAEEELLLVDDDALGDGGNGGDNEEEEPKIEVKVGEVFLNMAKSRAEHLVEERKAAAEERAGQLRGERESILRDMGELKRVLYGKFGNTINLEEEEEEETAAAERAGKY